MKLLDLIIRGYKVCYANKHRVRKYAWRVISVDW